jgi:hypothetical protein
MSTPLSKRTLRACAGLVLALLLAAATTPALGEGPAEDDVVRAAGVNQPRVVGPVDESAVPAPRPIMEQLASRLAEQVAQAEYAAALERVAAAEEAAKLERLAAAIEAEQARAAEAARQAEEARATAAAPSAPAGSVEGIIQRYFGASASKAISVARCESGLNPRAVSPGGGNHGLFQINNVHQGTFQSVTGAPWSAVYDAETNARFAHWLWSQQGWGPWACA